VLLEVRGQWGREERPRLANEEAPNVTNAIGPLRNGQLPAHDPVRQALPGRGEPHLDQEPAHGEGGHRIQPRLRRPDLRFNQFGAYNISGTDTATLLDTMGTGGTIANRFDANTATYLLQLGNLLASYSTDEVAVFAQDNWKVKPNLTINAGLRWEGAFNPTPDASNTTMANQVKSFNFPLRQTDPTAQIPNQLGQFGPRLGFAWDPTKDGRNRRPRATAASTTRVRPRCSTPGP
jgi:outer membrane receptor protein involved in Fe transport